MKIIDITFDLETTSLSADAAILQIGAVAWNRFADGNNPFFDFGEKDMKYNDAVTARDYKGMFLRNLSLNEQFIAGCDIDKDTQFWWSQQDEHVKSSLLDSAYQNACDGLKDFFDFMINVRDCTSADVLNLWCQGPDTDIAILKMAAKRFLNINPHNFPVVHTRFRDCRTTILEGGLGYMIEHAGDGIDDPDPIALGVKQNKLLDEYVADPNIVYKYLPSMPESVIHDIEVCGISKAHNALYDAVRSSWNCWCVLQNYTPETK